MPEFLRIVALFKEHMEGELKRSDVLRALIWPNSGLLLTLTIAGIANVETWLLVVLTALLVAFMALYAWAYVFFAKGDSDALRSESYKLRKLAIEHGVYGDSIQGQLEPPKREASGTIDLSPTDKTP